MDHTVTRLQGNILCIHLQLHISTCMNNIVVYSLLRSSTRALHGCLATLARAAASAPGSANGHPLKSRGHQRPAASAQPCGTLPPQRTAHLKAIPWNGPEEPITSRMLILILSGIQTLCEITNSHHANGRDYTLHRLWCGLRTHTALVTGLLLQSTMTKRKHGQYGERVLCADQLRHFNNVIQAHNTINQGVENGTQRTTDDMVTIRP